MVSALDRKRILSKTSAATDTLTEKPSKKWMSVDDPMLNYQHSRPLPKTTAKKAIKYINQLVSIYPFQIRYAMAIPLWERFAQAWCDTGDEKESLRVV
jgi:hypothetical protein